MDTLNRNKNTSMKLRADEVEAAEATFGEPRVVESLDLQQQLNSLTETMEGLELRHGSAGGDLEADQEGVAVRLHELHRHVCRVLCPLAPAGHSLLTCKHARAAPYQQPSSTMERNGETWNLFYEMGRPVWHHSGPLTSEENP